MLVNKAMNRLNNKTNIRINTQKIQQIPETHIILPHTLIVHLSQITQTLFCGDYIYLKNKHYMGTQKFETIVNLSLIKHTRRLCNTHTRTYTHRLRRKERAENEGKQLQTESKIPHTGDNSTLCKIQQPTGKQ